MFNIFSYSDRSPKWREVRKEHIKNQPECQGCGRTKDVEVHHIEPFHINPSRELDPTNLITLCSKHCHFIFGHLMDYKSWNSHVIEDCQIYKNKLQQRPYHEEYNQKPINTNTISRMLSWFGWHN